MPMTEKQAKKIFDQYNPSDGVVRSPRGRAKMIKSLDLYAKAAVNLYGIIRLYEFVEIFYAQNEEQTTSDEVYLLLLPNVLKDGCYGFYKKYLLHYTVLDDFGWVEYLEKAQSDKDRYLPPKEELLRYEWEDYMDHSHWDDVRKYMIEIFDYQRGRTSIAYHEIKNHLAYGNGIHELGAIMEKHRLAFEDADQAQNSSICLRARKTAPASGKTKGIRRKK